MLRTAAAHAPRLISYFAKDVVQSCDEVCTYATDTWPVFDQHNDRCFYTPETGSSSCSATDTTIGIVSAVQVRVKVVGGAGEGAQFSNAVWLVYIL